VHEETGRWVSPAIGPRAKCLVKNSEGECGEQSESDGHKTKVPYTSVLNYSGDADGKGSEKSRRP
jgi:hypothetical protein